MKTRFLFLVLTFSSPWVAFCQQVGIGTTTPHASALMDVTSSTKGILVPRMTSAQRMAIATPATGLLVYDSNEKGFMFYNGTTWTNIGGNSGSSVFTITAGQVHNTGDINSNNFIFGRSSLPQSNESVGDGFLFFQKNKGAFRAGYLSSTDYNWAPENIGHYSTALGYNNKASGNSSIALGANNSATGTHSIAMGNLNKASGESSFVGGLNSESSGYGSFAFGSLNKALEPYSVALGETNISSGRTSMAINSENQAKGEYSLAAGHINRANGSSSAVFGIHNVANANSSFVIGMYNDTLNPNPLILSENDALFMIGNGDNNASRSNALTVLKNGKVGLGTSNPAATLDIQSGLGPNIPQIRARAVGADFVRLRMSNAAHTNSFWDLASITSNTTTPGAVMNFYYYHNGGGSNILSLQGNGNAFLLGTLTQNSDERLKKNITAIENPMDALNQLSGYHYQWKDEWRDSTIQTGLIAQEVEKVMPELVKEDEKGIKSVNYNGLVPYLLEAIKTLKAELDEIKASQNKPAASLKQ